MKSSVQIEQIQYQILAYPYDEMNQQDDTKHDLIPAEVVLDVLTSVRILCQRWIFLIVVEMKRSFRW